MTIKEFRTQHPEYNDMSDTDLAKSLHQKYYSDMDFGSFSKSFLVGDKSKSSVAKDIALTPVGLLESAYSQLGGMVTATVAGIAGLSKAVTTGWKEKSFEKGMEAGAKTIEDIQQATAYRPKTVTGEQGNALVSNVSDFFVGKPARIAGEMVTDATGYPALGATVSTPLEFGGYAALFGGPKAVKTLRAPLAPLLTFSDVVRTLPREQQAPFVREVQAEAQVTGKPPVVVANEKIRGGEPRIIQAGYPDFEYTKGRTTAGEASLSTPQGAVTGKPQIMYTGEQVPPRITMAQSTTDVPRGPAYVQGGPSSGRPGIRIMGTGEGEAPRIVVGETTREPGSAFPESTTTITKPEMEVNPIESPAVSEGKIEPASAEPKSSGGTTLYSNPLSTVTDFYTENVGKPIKEAIVKRIPASIREFWSPLSTIPQSADYLYARSQSKGFIQRGEEFAKKVFDKLDEFDEQGKKNVFQAVNGEIPVTNLQPKQQTAARQIIAINDRLGQAMVNDGILKPEQFAAHKGQYIHYMYLKHVLGEDTPMPLASGKIDTSILKSRKDLTMEQRRAIGLIEDVAVAEATTIAKTTKNIGMNKLFDTVSSNPEWTWQPGKVKVGSETWSVGKLSKELDIQRKVAEQAPTPEVMARLNELDAAMQQAQQAAGQMPEGFVKMPETSSWGPLAGQFVRKEIAKDLIPMSTRLNEPTGIAGKSANFVADAAEKAMTMFKVGKTALNIPTGARNIGSNIIQLNASGIPLYDLPIHMAKAAHEMATGGPQYVTAKRNGLFKSNWAQGEIVEVMDVVRKSQGSKFNPIEVAKDLAKYYGKIDDFFKLTKMMEQLDSGKPLQTAILEANKWGMDYSLASRSIKAARRTVAPFVSYQYKIAPLLAETAIERPWVIAKYAAIPYAMYEIAKSSMNLTEDDWKKLKRELPLYIKKNQTYTILPWKSPEGNAQWVNLEYFLPWQQMMAIGRDVKQGNYGELVGDFGIGNPILDVYTVAKTMKGEAPPKDPFTNKDIYNNLDSPTEKAIKSAEFIYNKWAPTMLTRQGAAGYTAKAITGEKDRYGRTVTPEQAAGRWMGVNIVSPTPIQTAKEKRALVMDLRASLSRITKDPTVSTEKKREAQQRFRDKLQELRQMSEE